MIAINAVVVIPIFLIAMSLLILFALRITIHLNTMYASRAHACMICRYKDCCCCWIEAHSLPGGLVADTTTAASTATPSAEVVDVVIVLDDPDTHSQLSVTTVLDWVFGGMAGYMSVLRS